MEIVNTFKIDFILAKQKTSCSKDWFLSICRHLHLNVLFQGYRCVCLCVCVCVCVCVCDGEGGGAGKGIHLLIFHEVVWHITKSSSAAGRTRCWLGNTSTCLYVRFDIQESHHQLQEWSKWSSKSSSAAVFHHVLLLSSWRLVRPAADDDFVIC